MTTAALAAKLAKDNPPPSYQTFDLLNSPEFKELADQAIIVAQMSKRVEAFKGKGKIEGWEFNGGQRDLEAMITASEAEKVGYENGFVIKLTRGQSAPSVSATRLVELGVSLDIIAEATVDGTPWTSVQVVAPKVEK